MAGALNWHVSLAGFCHPCLNDHYLQRSQQELDDSTSCFYLRVVFSHLNLFTLQSLLRLQSNVIASSHHVSPVESSRPFLFCQFVLQNISSTAKSKSYFDQQEEFSHLGPFTHLNQLRLHLKAIVQSHHALLFVSSHLCLLDPSVRQRLLQVAKYCGLLNQQVEFSHHVALSHSSLHGQHSMAGASNWHVSLAGFCHSCPNDHYLQRSQLESDDSTNCFYLQVVFSHHGLSTHLYQQRLHSEAEV